MALSDANNLITAQQRITFKNVKSVRQNTCGKQQKRQNKSHNVRLLRVKSKSQ